MTRLTEEEVIAKSARNRAARRSIIKLSDGSSVEVIGPESVVATGGGGGGNWVNKSDAPLSPPIKPKTIREKKAAQPKPPSEHIEQCKVIEWADKHPIAGLIFAIPNGSHKSPAMAAKFKREGLRSGVPDLFLPVPCGALWNGLFVEMKRVKGSITSEAQYHWHEALLSQGYQVKVCRGAEDAIKVIQEYLHEPLDNKGE